MIVFSLAPGPSPDGRGEAQGDAGALLLLRVIVTPWAKISAMLLLYMFFPYFCKCYFAIIITGHGLHTRRHCPLFNECYVVHKGKAVVVRSNIFDISDKDTAKQLIEEEVEKLRT